MNAHTTQVNNIHMIDTIIYPVQEGELLSHVKESWRVFHINM